MWGNVTNKDIINKSNADYNDNKNDAYWVSTIMIVTNYYATIKTVEYKTVFHLKMNMHQYEL